ncbi:hypothetical protein Sjap_014742 [Stephania japonica]|uniref:Adenosylhomocysteinase n=1 Tax=Stephania japonica TaxID=461633 RepID=A0AAP0NS74_9MAGN
MGEELTSNSRFPSSRTSSRSVIETVNGKHIASEKFTVGGYDWAIYFYPDGKNPEYNATYVSVFIALASEGTYVRALFELTLLDQSGKGKHKVHSHFERSLESGPYALKYRGNMWGYKRFFRRAMLETSDFLKDDCLKINCSLSLFSSASAMALLVEKTSSGREYKVKDLSQADFGRLEIELAEVEMPGLMACRTEFSPSQPFKGARITESLHMTIQTAVLIETLTALGAEVRWCSCNIFSTQDHATAAIARDSAAVFALKGETLQEYWWCTERALDWGPGGGPNPIVDDGGDATLSIHEGVKAEEEFAKSGKVPDPNSTDNAEFRIVPTIIRDGLKSDPEKYHKMKEGLVGVSEETTTGVKSKFDNCTVVDTLSRTPDEGDKRHDHGKVALVAGHETSGRDVPRRLNKPARESSWTEIDPISCSPSNNGGSPVLTLEDVVSDVDIFVTTTSNKDIIMVDHMRKMKNNAIALVCSSDPASPLFDCLLCTCECAHMIR